MVEPELSERVPIGVLGRPYGLRGEMRVRLFDPTSSSLFSVEEVLLQSSTGGAWTARQVRDVRVHGQDIVIAFHGVVDRTGAEELKGHTLAVNRDELPRTEPGEYYDFDLVGLDVLVEDRRLGRVTAVEHPPANDVLVVELEDSDDLLDLPLIEPIISQIDLEGRRILVDLPEGLPTRKSR